MYMAFHVLYVLHRYHCWQSFEGSAEVYNEVMRETDNSNYNNLKRYMEKHPFSHTVKAIGTY